MFLTATSLCLPAALSMTTSSRRAALTTFASGLLLATPASMALVDADEDSAAMVRRIAAKSEAANVAARTKKIKEEEDAKNNAGKGQNLVATGLVGSVVLSLPFFLPNLIRLGKKVASGGEDDGYGKKK
jgi:hypothetical protein